MILGTGPTQQNPVNFTPPQPGGGNVFRLPKTGFYSQQVTGNMFPAIRRVSAYPAYHPVNSAVGPQQLPALSPPPPAAAPAAPAPGPTPSGTAGAFGGSGFGTSGGVRAHSHSMNPYQVMRTGQIPGVHPNGSNIRSGYMNAGMRVDRSMPFQSFPLPPDMPPPPPPMPAAAPGAAMPTATHGFGSFSWNPLNWFRKRTHSDAVAAQAINGFGASNCEWVGPRLDGTKVQICGGRVIQVADAQGNVLYNAYANPDAY
jgi:hypothetical protein